MGSQLIKIKFEDVSRKFTKRLEKCMEIAKGKYPESSKKILRNVRHFGKIISELWVNNYEFKIL